MARFEVRSRNVNPDVLLIIATDKFESEILDRVFGKRVRGRDGLIYQRTRKVQVKLSDGYGEHYLSVQGKDRHDELGMDQSEVEQ